MAASAAVVAALALAGPAVSASAAATAPTARAASVGLAGSLLPGVSGPLPPGSLPCLFLVRQIQFALLTHNTVLANFLSTVFLYSGCGGAAT